MQELTQLIEILENYVEADEISPEDNFRADLDMSSFDTMCLITDVKTVFGVDLNARDFIDYKTVGEMAQYIASAIQEN